MAILKLGFIGLGNFGGQVANALNAIDVKSMVFNASEKDLDMLDKGVTPFCIGDGKGTGKSRDTAKMFLMENISVLEDPVINEFINDCDAVFIGGSAGGGFGSGATPKLVQILSAIYPNKCFDVITTLPSINETYTAQNHAEQFIRELIDLNTGYLIYDNDQFINMEASEMNRNIIQCIVDDMKILRGDYILPTKTGGIDERDLLTVLSVPGRIVCSGLHNIRNVPNERIAEQLKKNIKGHAQLTDDKIINASAIMYNFILPDLKAYAPNITSDVQELFGPHIADYRNEVIDNESAESFIVCILSGLSAPSERIDQIVNRRLKLESELEDRHTAAMKLNSVQAGGLKLSVKSFNTSKPKDTQAIGDILKKFADAENNKITK